jgi:hypothetical protein
MVAAIIVGVGGKSAGRSRRGFDWHRRAGAAAPAEAARSAAHQARTDALSGQTATAGT